VRTYTVRRNLNATSYNWSYSGTGAVIVNKDTTAVVAFDLSATSGNLTVAGSNPECGNGPASSLPIMFYPPPQVNLASFDSICFNEPAFQFSGGSPSGGEYQINGTPVAGFDPAAQGAGSHLVVYRYADAHGCKNADSAAVFVKTGRACEIVIWVPNAFTPDGDGLNDVYRPVSANIRGYSLIIFNRDGEQVFSASIPENGWDGTYKGRPCPEGNYVYILVYQSSLAPPENTTLTGNIVLVR
jgi:gliding motility-associated-like protein